MKGTEHFKTTIQVYLESRAANDKLFAASFANPAKNIDNCITYILNIVQKSGCNGFADEEIFGQAVHYYDEIDIEVGKAGEAARYSWSDVVQRWLSPDGKEATVARLRAMSIMYYDIWNFGSELEIRTPHRAYD